MGQYETMYTFSHRGGSYCTSTSRKKRRSNSDHAQEMMTETCVRIEKKEKITLVPEISDPVCPGVLVEGSNVAIVMDQLLAVRYLSTL